MLTFDEECDDWAVVEECGQKIMKKYKINQTLVNKMLNGSFEEEDNPILQKLSTLRYKNGIVYYPTVIVNSIIYRGNLQPFEIFELIC